MTTFRWLAVIFSALSLLTKCQAGQLRRGSQDATSDINNQQEQRQLSESVGTFEWSYDFAKKAAVGFNLTLIVKDDYLDKQKINTYNEEVFQSFKVFGDLLDDRTLVVKDDDVCYLAIRGQERHILFDIWQTLSPFVKRNAFGSGCNVKRSFYYAYDACFADDMRAALDECVASCADGPCPVVLHGHSTGASAVTIAALDPRIKKYNPTIFAMAPLRAIVTEGCEDEDLAKIYRIVAANAGIYDGATDGRLHAGHHYGKFFMMDEMNDFYYIAPTDDGGRMPDSLSIHGLEVYSNRMEALAARPASDFPLTLSQFPDGHWCNYNDECESGLCSVAKICASGEEFNNIMRMEGAPCTEGTQCTSGICKFEKCALSNGKMAEGSPCEEHSDCATNKCSEGACLSQFFNGSFCNEDYECASQSCSGSMSFIALMMRRCADPEE